MNKPESISAPATPDLYGEEGDEAPLEPLSLTQKTITVIFLTWALSTVVVGLIVEFKVIVHLFT